MNCACSACSRCKTLSCEEEIVESIAVGEVVKWFRAYKDRYFYATS